ncbi:MAG: Asp-tRNA(Asn)/Glu-tRNA(Gln) amidotransferase subunit GatC [Rhodobacteraceae bacterium]|nr:Asp-tRNA(Asn)/Glu-tRNA(Gln) amidotransferase subunit GatC [Paracoccaceae bacterium]
MEIDKNEAARVAHLARIHVDDHELARIAKDLSAIIGFMQQLNEVDIEGVDAMTTATPMVLVQRDDTVKGGGLQKQLMDAAPVAQEGFYLVPKVVE